MKNRLSWVSRRRLFVILHKTLTRQKNIEIFLRDCSKAVIIHWLTETFGPLRKVETGPIIYHTTQLETRLSIVIEQHVADGTYTGIYIAPNTTSWDTDVDFARAAFRVLTKEVRCDPGILSSKPWHWLQISQSGEELVEWEAPDEDAV